MHAHLQSPVIPIGSGDPTVVVIDDLPGNRQAQPVAFATICVNAAEKRAEQLR